MVTRDGILSHYQVSIRFLSSVLFILHCHKTIVLPGIGRHCSPYLLRIFLVCWSESLRRRLPPLIKVLFGPHDKFVRWGDSVVSDGLAASRSARDTIDGHSKKIQFQRFHFCLRRQLRCLCPTANPTLWSHTSNPLLFLNWYYQSRHIPWINNNKSSKRLLICDIQELLL